ncbi:hypothetical protein GUITHDRAFT_111377 [Guillardia theta CCMP2712]|uniref:EF-hand domain-containing protein n=1 Tax=Guillardia theta (strain CCMP2712) TaxID=905079 RepID=L1J3N8_GUITC|nr:hypothetical protein GUITHDRAFT_111377 [Guillardia theta CCMP2712]EKX42705.1 hypothetical protein GUITHDRAFT_111377 [Guillardia theta CCMP2712]|eukprot:XP_005829685.1 hypothetical protein GUITHDRAFT_111377 [Guillardia theta CCMP2712]
MGKKKSVQMCFQLALCLLVLMARECAGADGYIELTKDGFRVSDMVTMQKGMAIEGDLVMNGYFQSFNFTAESRNTAWGGFYDGECTPSRKGAIRWSYTIFESCDGISWKPLKHCSRDCGFQLPPPYEISGCQEYNCTEYCCPRADSMDSCHVVSSSLRLSSTDVIVNGSSKCDMLLKTICNPMTNLTCTEVEISPIPFATSKWYTTSIDPAFQQTFIVPEYSAVNISNSSGAARPVQQYTCSTLDYNSSAFDYLKALYNSSGWWKAVPGIPQDTNADSLNFSCFDKVQNAGFAAAPTILKGAIGDGPGNYGVYEKTNKFGPTIQITLFSYVYVSEDPTATIDLTLVNNPLEGWEVGSDIRFTFEVSATISGVVLDQLTAVFATVTTLDKETMKISLTTPYTPDSKASVSTSIGIKGDASLVIPTFCVPFGGGCKPGNYTGTSCAWKISSPKSSYVQLQFLKVELADNVDSVYVYDITGLPVYTDTNYLNGNRSDIAPLAIFSGNMSAAALQSMQSKLISPYGGEFLVVFNSGPTTSAWGFEAVYTLMPRLGKMIDEGIFTNLQFSIAFLEYYNANVTKLISQSAKGRYESLYDTGTGVLGPMTEAEQCFRCCSNLIPTHPVVYQGQGFPVFNIRPNIDQVGRDAVATKMLSAAVDLSEIPDLCRYMGYLPEHYYRTGYISRFPTGSIKVPTAFPLGKRPVWGKYGNTDPSASSQPVREAIGWGLSPVLVGSRSSWLKGWGDTEGDHEGARWWDGDGANGNAEPDWSIVSPPNQVVDEVRFNFDLDHGDVPLYSFVDSQRRLVISNAFALSTRCGQLVNSSCGVSCGVRGTGLNILQCLDNIPLTRCGQPVVDMCNNDCKMLGEQRCNDTAVGLGSVRIGSQHRIPSGYFQFGVGRPDNLHKDNMFLSFQSLSDTGATLELLQLINDPFDVSNHMMLNVYQLQQILPSNVHLILNRIFDNIPAMKCSLIPPNCGQTTSAKGYFSSYQLQNQSWPFCPLYNTFNDPICKPNANPTAITVSDLFKFYDRNSSGYLERPEILSLSADLESRRQLVKEEIWSRATRAQRDLVRFQPLRSAAGDIFGLELDSPSCPFPDFCLETFNTNTMRVSSSLELLGEYIQIGQSRYGNISNCSNISSTEFCYWDVRPEPLSRVFIDGQINGACPVQMSANHDSFSTSLCVERTDNENKTLLLPDTNGIVVLTSNLDVVPFVPGLRGNRTLFFTGDMYQGNMLWKYDKFVNQDPRPPAPRIDCANVPCSTFRPMTTFSISSTTLVWTLIDRDVYMSLKDVYLPSLPSFKKYVCLTVLCDIQNVINDMQTKWSLTLRRDAAKQQVTVSGSAIAAINGIYTYVNESLYTNTLANGRQIFLMRLPARDLQGGVPAASRGEFGGTCVDLEKKFALDFNILNRRKEGQCMDLKVSVMNSIPYCGPGCTLNGVTDAASYGLNETNVCCDCGGGSTPAHVYDFLRVYYMEGNWDPVYNGSSGAWGQWQTLSTVRKTLFNLVEPQPSCCTSGVAANPMACSGCSLDSYTTMLDYLTLHSNAEINVLNMATQQTTSGGQFPVTGVESCYLCCHLPAAAEVKPKSAAGVNVASSMCEWVEVSGLYVQKNLEGFYQQMYPLGDLDPGSQGRPVYRHSSGRFYLFFLARACTHLNKALCPAQQPAWVVADTLGTDSARLIAYQVTDGPGQVTTEWQEFDGSLYAQRNFTLESPITVQCTQGNVGQQSERPMPLWSEPVHERLLNYTTGVGFVDPSEHHKLTLPDTLGTVVATGASELITRLGTLVSPIVSQASAQDLTRVQFGVEWQYVNATERTNTLSGRYVMDMAYCYFNRSVSLTAKSSKTVDVCDPRTAFALPLADRFLYDCQHLFSLAGLDNSSVIILQSDCDNCLFWFPIKEVLVGSFCKDSLGRITNITCEVGVSKCDCVDAYEPFDEVEYANRLPNNRSKIVLSENVSIEYEVVKVWEGETFSVTASYRSNSTYKLCPASPLAQSTFSFGFARIETQVEAKVAVGTITLDEAVASLNQQLDLQLGNRTVLIRFSLDRPGLGWRTHEAGNPIPIPDLLDRQRNQTALLPGGEAYDGYGRCGDLDSASSYDPGKFFCPSTSRVVQLQTAVFNASGRRFASDLVAVKWHSSAQSSLPASDIPVTKLLNFYSIEQYGLSGSEITFPLAQAANTSNSVKGSTADERGQPLMNNTVHVPSSADGVVLSTGNLVDINNLTSSMTSFAVNALKEASAAKAVQLHDWLDFGQSVSGYSYIGRTSRIFNPISYPGPGRELVTAAEQVHPYLADFDLQALHAALKDDVVDGVMKSMGTLVEKPPWTAARAQMLQLFSSKISATFAGYATSAFFSRLEEYAAGGGAVTGIDFFGLNSKAVRLGQSRFSSGVRLVPDSPEGVGKLALNLSSLPSSSSQVSKRTILNFEQFQKHRPGLDKFTGSSWFGSKQYRQDQGRFANISFLKVPAVQGSIVTTGNLEDISASSGAITSVHVSNDVVFHDTVRLGDNFFLGDQLHMLIAQTSVCDGVLMPATSLAVGEGIGRGTCFKSFKGAVSWESAQQSCREWGGFLAVFADPQTQSFARSRLNLQGSNWVGLSSRDYPTVWVWRGQGIPDVYLSSSQISTSLLMDATVSFSRRCGAMDSNSNWNAFDCSSSLPYVCQRPDMPLAAMSYSKGYETCGNSFHAEGCGNSATHLGFQIKGLVDPNISLIEFPVVNSGVVITTGNLQDLTFLDLDYLYLNASANLMGQVTLGSNITHYNKPFPITPISFQGYLIGDFVFKNSMADSYSTIIFEPPDGPRTIVFPDESGTVITTGNLEDIDNNVGLRGQDPIIVHHTLIDYTTTLQGVEVPNPWLIVDFAAAGSRESLSLGLVPVPLPPGSSKGSTTVDSSSPRGIWYLVDLGPDGKFRDGDDIAYYMENTTNLGGGRRPLTGWTVPCSPFDTITIGVCAPTDWVDSSYDFLHWEEYHVDLVGASPRPRIVPAGTSVCPSASNDQAFIAGETLRYATPTQPLTTWDDSLYEPSFRNCSYVISGAGSAEVNGRYVYAGKNDNVARFRKEGSNIYLFRWGSMNQRITFPDATGIVITTGNPNDLVFTKISLLSLDLDADNYVGSLVSPLTDSGFTVISFDKYESVIVGKMQFANRACQGSTCYPFPTTALHIIPPTVKDLTTIGTADWIPELCRGKGVQEQLEKCNYCTAGDECAYKRELLFPDASGTVITTGNMQNLPAVAIPYNALSVGANAAMEGDVTLGNPTPELVTPGLLFKAPEYLRESRTVTCDGFEHHDERCVRGSGHLDVNEDGIKRNAVMMYTSMAGETGLTFKPAFDVASKVQYQGGTKFAAPDMEGIDAALEFFLTQGSQRLKIPVQDSSSYVLNKDFTSTHNVLLHSLRPSRRDMYLGAQDIVTVPQGWLMQLDVLLANRTYCFLQGALCSSSSSCDSPMLQSPCSSELYRYDILLVANTTSDKCLLAGVKSDSKIDMLQNLTSLVTSASSIPLVVTRKSVRQLELFGSSWILSSICREDGQSASPMFGSSSLQGTVRFSARSPLVSPAAGQYALPEVIAWVNNRTNDFAGSFGAEVKFNLREPGKYEDGELAARPFVEVMGMFDSSVQSLQNSLTLRSNSNFMRLLGFDADSVALVPPSPSSCQFDDQGCSSYLRSKSCNVYDTCRFPFITRSTQALNVSSLPLEDSVLAFVQTVTPERCFSILQEQSINITGSQGIHDRQELRRWLIERGAFLPTLRRGDAYETPVPSNLPQELSNVSDCSLSTHVTIPAGSFLAFDYSSRPISPSLLRIAPCSPSSSIVQWVLEGSNSGPHEGFQPVNLLVNQQMDSWGGAYVSNKVDTVSTQTYKWLRIVPTPMQEACYAEVEVHEGEVMVDMARQTCGRRSFFINSSSLVDPNNNLTAFVLKCASYNLFPRIDRMEDVVLGYDSGVVLTTGNFEDVTSDAGAMTSLSVKYDVEISGDFSVGTGAGARGSGDMDSSNPSMVFNSLIKDSLSFKFSSAEQTRTTVQVDQGIGDAVFLLEDISGTILTADRMSNLNDLNVLTQGTVAGMLSTLGDVQFGDVNAASSISLLSPISGREAMKFSGKSHASGTKTILSPSSLSLPSSLLVLPDASGSLLTAGNFPSTIYNVTFEGRLEAAGGILFEQSVKLGDVARPLGLNFDNSYVKVPQGLQFRSSTSKEGRTILHVEEPSKLQTLLLPDASGTILTTREVSQIPFDRLRVLEGIDVTGAARLEGERISIGSSTVATSLELNSNILGKFPLSFDCGMNLNGEQQPCLTFEMPTSSSSSTITFPDSSGVVITSGNLPNPLVTDSSFSLHTDSLVASSSSSIFIGLDAGNPVHPGSFLFVDSLPAGQELRTDGENQFKVIARGGVSLVTGYSPTGREIGAQLLPGSGSWSSLSDGSMKERVERVEGRRIAEKLVGVNISEWSYIGQSQRHVGPMAQDIARAFGLGADESRIDGMDADGLVLAAVTGTGAVMEESSRKVEQLKEKLLEIEERMTTQTKRLEKQRSILEEQQRRLERIVMKLSAAPVS